MQIQPLFYFPSTLVAVDDEPDGYEAMRSMLSPYHLKIFHKAERALHFLQNYQAPLLNVPFLRPIQADEEDLLENCSVDFNVLDIAALSKYPQKKQEISVLIVDFHMPYMNGLELCRALQHTPMKKILLTGDENYQQAISAFNQGLIHQFIPKKSPTLVEELLQAIEKLSIQYFWQRSQTLQAHLETRSPLPISDPAFIALFETWRQENNIQSYYLMDKTGSFLCIDTQGKKRYFIVHTQHSLDTFTELYTNDKRSESLIQSVRERQTIPFFGLGKSPWQEQAKTWKKAFYPAQTLAGRETYYWTAL